MHCSCLGISIDALAVDRGLCSAQAVEFPTLKDLVDNPLHSFLKWFNLPLCCSVMFVDGCIMFSICDCKLPQRIHLSSFYK